METSAHDRFDATAVPHKDAAVIEIGVSNPLVSVNSVAPAAEIHNLECDQEEVIHAARDDDRAVKDQLAISEEVSAKVIEEQESEAQEQEVNEENDAVDAVAALEEFERLFAEHSGKIQELEAMKTTYAEQKAAYENSLDQLATLQMHLDGLDADATRKKAAIKASLDGWTEYASEAHIQEQQEIADSSLLFDVEAKIKDVIAKQFNAMIENGASSNGMQLEEMQSDDASTYDAVTRDEEDVVISRLRSLRKHVSFDSSALENDYSQALALLENENITTDESKVEEALNELKNIQSLENTALYERRVEEELVYLKALKNELEVKRTVLRKEYEDNMAQVCSDNEDREEEVESDEEIEDISLLIDKLRSSSVKEDEINDMSSEILSDGEAVNEVSRYISLEDGESQLAQNEDMIDLWMEARIQPFSL